MIRATNYLWIPRVYGRWLGGLRWSPGLEAVEYPIGTTFAFGRELALFIEGYASNAPLIHFGHILHLVHLFGHGCLTTAHRPMDLVELFRLSGRPLRNAGVLAAELCQGIPVLADPPSPSEVVLQLTRGPVSIDFEDAPARGPRPLFDPVPDEDSAGGADDSHISYLLRTHFEAEAYLPPAEFEKRFLEAWSRISPDDARHWLRFGRRPALEARDLAREIEAARPHSLGELLDSALGRPRLVAAASMVAHLAGALALPPRGLVHEVLPTGGYADLASHGHPERLLPAQFALDSEEFLRRFAERELLYYHREEPHAPEAEELVVLLDQGVRTWGSVRLVLAAATIALGRLADRRGLSFRLANSSSTSSLDLRSATPEQASSLLEASDLTENPSAALGAILDEAPPERRRDLLLLSHPRALADPSIEAAARLAPRGTRIFTVGADDRGHVAFDELRLGRPVPLVRFRVHSASPPSSSRTDREPPADGAWRGDVEPFGFPFRVGIAAREVGSNLFAFDGSGRNLICLDVLHVPSLFPLDGSPPETLPRPWIRRGTPLRVVEIIGVAGGFVLICDFNERRVALAHYDITQRRVRVIVPPRPRRGLWFYLPERHLLIRRQSGCCWALRLSTGETFEQDQPGAGPIEEEAIASIQDQVVPAPYLIALHDRDTLPASGPWLRLETQTGFLHLHGVQPEWPRFQPMADGQPVLAGKRVARAAYRGGTLALAVEDSRRSRTLLLYRGPSNPLPERPWKTDRPWEFDLSADGLHLACPHDLGARQPSSSLAVHVASRAGPPVLTTPAPRPPTTQVSLGPDWLALHKGPDFHILRWRNGLLQHHHVATPEFVVLSALLRKFDLAPPISMTPGGPLPAPLEYDPNRFRDSCHGAGLVAAVDHYGQVLLFQPGGRLLAMLFADRDRLAAWMPDGTRFGAAGLSGAPASPDAAERLARLLVEAPHAIWSEARS